MMESTRPTPPWVLPEHYAQTFLEKDIIIRVGTAANPPIGVVDPNLAREAIFQSESTIWTSGGG